jgi:hypothetical protein
MKGLVTQFILLLIFFVGQSRPQALPSLPAPDKDPFVGTWKANANKSKPKLDKDRASYVRTISREGGEIVFSSRARRPSGGFSENHYRIRCDGLSHRIQCGQASCKTSYWTREVSADGQEMIVFGYEDKARTKLDSTQVNDRVN